MTFSDFDNDKNRLFDVDITDICKLYILLMTKEMISCDVEILWSTFSNDEFKLKFDRWTLVWNNNCNIIFELEILFKKRTINYRLWVILFHVIVCSYSF